MRAAAMGPSMNIADMGPLGDAAAMGHSIVGGMDRTAGVGVDPTVVGEGDEPTWTHRQNSIERSPPKSPLRHLGASGPTPTEALGGGASGLDTSPPPGFSLDHQE